MMPLLSIRTINRITRSSPIRCRKNLTIHSWWTVSKNPRISASTTKLTFPAVSSGQAHPGTGAGCARVGTHSCVLEYGLVDRLQSAFRRFLYDFVLKGTVSQRPALFTARLRDVAPPLRLRSISHPLEPPGQVPKVGFKVPSVFFLRHAVHPGRLPPSSVS